MGYRCLIFVFGGHLRARRASNSFCDLSRFVRRYLCFSIAFALHHSPSNHGPHTLTRAVSSAKDGEDRPEARLQKTQERTDSTVLLEYSIPT
jgi:hypothetical protein